MTEKSSNEPEVGGTGDQEPYPFAYGHGRMPLFMKLVWVAAIAFMTWYVVKFLLTSLGVELGT
jgi:hypothetical protein